MAGHAAPIGGLAYYISPPQSLTSIMSDPIHAVIYTTFVITSCASSQEFGLMYQVQAQEMWPANSWTKN